MPDAFALANAFVRIRPESTGFLAEADRQIRTALAGLNPNVKIGASTLGAKAAARDLKGYLDALTKQNYDFRLVADDKLLQARLAKIFVQLVSLQGRMVAPKITLMGYARMQAELLALGAEMEQMARRVSVAHVDVAGDAEKQLALLQAQIVALTAQAHDIKLGITDAAGLVAIAAIQKALAGVASHVATLTIGTDTSKIAMAEQQVAQLSQDLAALTSKTVIASAAGRQFGGVLGLIAARIPLFTGLGPGILGSIAAWHLLVDVAIEFLAVLIPATIGLIAFGAAAAPAVGDIVKQMRNLQITTEATGQHLFPLTGAFQKVADAVQPQVYQLFGDMLTIANSKTGEFRKLATGAGQALDILGARTAAAIQSSSMSVFLDHAASDLAKLGDIVGNIFGTIGNLLKTMPGYAQILLNIIDGVTKSLESITGSGFVQGIIKVGLAFHGAAVYIGLAAAAAQFLVRGGLTQVGNLFQGIAVRLAPMNGLLGRAGVGFMGLSAGAAEAAALPWGWIAVAAAGLGFLVFKLVTAKDATQQWFASLQQVLLAQNAVKGLTTLQTDQAVVAARLATAQTNLNRILSASEAAGGRNQAAPVDKTSAAYLRAAQASRDYGSELTVLNDQSALYNARLSKLAIVFGGTGQAQGILIASGVKMSQMLDGQNSAWVQILQQVQATEAAYRAMGQTGGILGADMNALNLAASDQVTQMQKLNGAWDTVIGIISGGQTSFITFQQDLLSVAKALAQAGGSARIVTQTFPATAAAIAAAAKHSGATMTGLNAASLQLRQTWQTAFTGGASLIDALRLMQSASPGGFPSVTRAVKDILAQLVPLGKTSKATRAELVSLAQEINPNIHNFGQLTKWLGNTKNAGRDLNKLLANMGVNLQDLAKDAANLYATLQNAIIKQFDIAKLSASGASLAIHNLATDVTHVGTSAKKIHGDEAALYKDFLKSGLSAKDATTLILSMAGGVSLTGKTASQKHQQMVNLYNDFRKAGLGAKAAADLVHALTGELFKVPKNVHSNVSVSTPHAFIFAEKSGGVNNPIGELHVTQSAKGSRVPGYGGGDKHLYLLEGGEAVVSKEMTAKHAKALASWGVPGMASGGIAGLAAIPGKVSGAFGADEGAALAADVTAALRADIAAAKSANAAARARAAAGFGVAGPGGGAPAANAALARKMMPSWGSGMEWNAWNALEMMEAGWNQFARNPSSGAYGIPQALPPSKMGPAANPPQSNPAAQISWMIGYIRSRYGDPINAAAHENAFHWYGAGTGSARAGWAVVGEGGPELVKMNGGETVLPAGQSRMVGYAKGTHNRLNEKVDRVLGFLHRNPNDPAAFTRLENQLALVSASVHSERLLVRSGRLHGVTLRHEREQLSDDRQEQKRLLREIHPYSKTRKWVRDVIGALGTRDTLFTKEAGAALALHRPQIADHFTDRVKQDTKAIKTMNTWMDRVSKIYTRKQQASDTRWIDSVIIDALKDAGLPVVSFDRGGWLQPGATLAVNNTGRREKIGGGGEAVKVQLEFGTGPHGTVEAALWNWLLHSVDVKGGGDVQVALGRKA